jgi:hypothetical protein
MIGVGRKLYHRRPLQSLDWVHEATVAVSLPSGCFLANHGDVRDSVGVADILHAFSEYLLGLTVQFSELAAHRDM